MIIAAVFVISSSIPHPLATHVNSDLVEGLIKQMNCNYSLPINLGNPEEHTIKEFAHIIQEEVGEEKEREEGEAYTGFRKCFQVYNI